MSPTLFIALTCFGLGVVATAGLLAFLKWRERRADLPRGPLRLTECWHWPECGCHEACAGASKRMPGTPFHHPV